VAVPIRLKNREVVSATVANAAGFDRMNAALRALGLLEIVLRGDKLWGSVEVPCD